MIGVQYSLSHEQFLHSSNRGKARREEEEIRVRFWMLDLLIHKIIFLRTPAVTLASVSIAFIVIAVV